MSVFTGVDIEGTKCIVHTINAGALGSNNTEAVTMDGIARIINGNLRLLFVDTEIRC